ncbi:MAG: hypothetical protein K2Q15_15145, partial [Burkholderiales bacterium]|nr:hypothetical protein [Burkholderiales bacterium]
VAATKEKNEVVGEQLAATLRDALVGYYLGQLVPNDDDMEPYRSRLQSVDDLYDFLLLDTQVSYKVKTAGVAQAIKSIQQYINRITLNLEPGLSTTPEENENWSEFANRYGYWAANQQLKIYPEVYIDPTLRLGKTDLFFQLESVLNQGKLDEDTVQRAVLGYLNNFEDISNLDVLSGYQTGVDIGQDKLYFVAKTRSQPYAYYWRSLDMTQGESDTLNLFPSAWSAWKKINLPLEAAEPRTVRPVLLNNRLYISWVENSEETEEGSKRVSGFSTKLQLANLKFDGSWSTPNTVRQTQTIQKDQMTDLIAVMDSSGVEDKLVLVAYTSKIGIDEATGFYDFDVVFTYVCDSMLMEFTDFPPSNNTLTDADYYGSKLVWFYSHELANLYPEDPPQFPDTDEGKLARAYARRDAARELILYPYVNNTEQIIADNTLISGAESGVSGSVGKGTITHDISFMEGDVNKLSVIANFKDFNYFSSQISEANNLDTILFGIWIWTEGKDDDDSILSLGSLCNLAYRAYSADGTLQGTESFPEDGAGTVSATLTLSPGYEIFIQSGFSLFKKNDDFGSMNDPGGRYTAKYYVGKRFRPLLQNKRYDKVAYIQFPEKYANNNHGTIRLNTLFAKELISRAYKGIDYVLDWTAQNISEPPVTEVSSVVPIDFSGANGIYFWELFFHMPYLVAWRLNIEQRYAEATTWLNYIFNPNESLNQPELLAGKPRYWNSRPLCSEEDLLNRGLVQPSDPDAIAESDPVHYQKSIFRFHVQNLIDEGDKEYRQLSPTSRTVARLSYATAGALLGSRPDIQMASTWQTRSLQDVADNSRSERRLLEMETMSLPMLPVTHDASVTNQDNDLFLDPFNSKLTLLWDTLEQRLYNLRHNLSIDGKELSSQLYDTPIDPMALQSKRYQRVVALRNAGASKFVVPNYRFAPMLNKAMSGVETLIQFGSTLLSLLERKDGLNFDRFQMNQQLSMYGFTINLQEQAIQMSEAELESSAVGREMAMQRYQHYKTLYDENVSNTEKEVIGLQAGAADAIVAAQTMRTAAAIMDLMPNTFGLAVGGMNWGAPLNAMAESVMIHHHSQNAKAESLSVSESYRRRRQEWEIQYQQAELEMSAIDKQIQVQQRQVQAAKTQLKQIETEYAHAQTLLDYFSSRFTNENLYTWMTSQLSSVYLKAYDAVMSMCLTAEAAWQYEIGQFDSKFMQPGCWNDVYQGLLVGETMKLALVQMDQAFMYQNSRRQEITKTISLKKHDSNAFDRLKTSGEMEFSFTEELHFVPDFNNLTNRRIQTVAVSLPALLGPYQDICATLTQVNSTIDGTVGTDTKQIVLSHGMQDGGMFTLNY